MPSKNTFLIQTSAFITPAINSSLTFLYGEGINFFFFSPNISYDINSSLDASLIGQFFYMENMENSGGIENVVKGIYVQFKYSF